MSRQRRRSVSAWLALFAMMLMTVAPVISQSLAAAHASSLPIAAQAEYCGHADAAGQSHGVAHDAMTDSAMASEPAPSHSSHSSSSGHAAWHEACGYCTLATSGPMLLAVCASLLCIADASADPVYMADDYRGVAASFYPRALTRAPPFST